MITNKEEYKLFNIQDRNTLESLVFATATPLDLEANWAPIKNLLSEETDFFFQMCRETGCPVDPLRNKATIFVVSTGDFQETSSFQSRRQADTQSHNEFFVFWEDCISSVRYKWNKPNFLQNQRQEEELTSSFFSLIFLS